MAKSSVGSRLPDLKVPLRPPGVRPTYVLVDSLLAFSRAAGFAGGLAS